jgi:hypothetical protein
VGRRWTGPLPGIRFRVSRFLHELRRRKVLEILLHYLVGAFLLTRILRLGEAWAEWSPELRESVVRYLWIGVPVILLLAWLLQVTPEGMRTVLNESTGGALGEDAPAGPPWFSLTGVVTALTLVALGLFLHVLAL